MFRNFKVLLIVLVAIIVAGSAFAFAATNTVADSAAGYKASEVPGYTVTNKASLQQRKSSNDSVPSP